MRRYRTPLADNARWDGFAFRDGDIVISTPPKSGTTWMQMICVLLVFRCPKLDRPLDELSPWFDALTLPRESVVATLEAQQHRRIIKSHTPLDGLPFDTRVTYVCVARDPRDVCFSLSNHLANVDVGAVRRAQEDAGLDAAGAASELAESATEAADKRDWFRHWIEDPTPVTDAPPSLRTTLLHFGTFWDKRELPNVILVHYDDLKADLPAEMRRLARQLGIDVPESAWPSLERAATFESMRADADRLVPDFGRAIFQDRRRFFNCGGSGQWAGTLDDADLREYEAQVTDLASPDLLEWVHHQQPVGLP